MGVFEEYLKHREEEKVRERKYDLMISCLALGLIAGTITYGAFTGAFSTENRYHPKNILEEKVQPKIPLNQK